MCKGAAREQNSCFQRGARSRESAAGSTATPLALPTDTVVIGVLLYLGCSRSVPPDLTPSFSLSLPLSKYVHTRTQNPQQRVWRDPLTQFDVNMTQPRTCVGSTICVYAQRCLCSIYQVSYVFYTILIFPKHHFFIFFLFLKNTFFDLFFLRN